VLRSTASVVALVLTSLAAAQSAPERPRIVPYPIDLPAAFERAIANGTRTATGRPGPNYWTNTARYRLDVELDPSTAMLSGTAKMTYVNRSPDDLDSLWVHLYQDMRRPGAMRTRFVVPGDGITLREVRVDGKPVRARSFDTRLVLPVDVAAGGEAEIEIDYAFPVQKEREGPRMGHQDEDVFYLGYWYPQFAVYDDVDGWVADPYRGNGEFYMDYADYDVALTVPQGYLVRATGELQNADEVLTAKEREALAQAREGRDIVHVLDADDLAAGAQTATSPTGKLTWKFHADNVRDFAISAARTYLWDATHAVVKDKDGPGKDGIAMIHAVYQQGTGDWRRAAEYARHTIEFLSAQVYPYPWPHMTACQGIIGGGMEYPMMTIAGGGKRPESLLMHELTHMWFPMLVGSNEKRYAWQDEGFTSFWSTLCVDAFRERTSGPRRDILDYVRTVRRGDDAVCMRHADAYGADDFGFASYGKPAAVLHQLRGLLGDETFFAAFRRYTADWAWKHPTPYDFFRTFRDVSGQDLEPYFRTWLFETWQLDHAVGDVTSDGEGTAVVIEDLGRALQPAVVEVTYGDGHKARQTVPVSLWQQGRRAVLRFGADVAEVEIDPDTTSLDRDRKNNRWKRQQ
jgi:hypothetical protein